MRYLRWLPLQSGAIALFAGALLFGCGANDTFSPTIAGPVAVGVSVSPNPTNVGVNGQKNFTATVTGTNNTAVTWSVQPGGAGGTIDQNGVYTAPAAPGTDVVVATSVADNTKSGSATVNVQAGNLQGNIN